MPVVTGALSRTTADGALTVLIRGIPSYQLQTILRETTALLWDQFQGRLRWISDPTSISQGVLVTIDTGADNGDALARDVLRATAKALDDLNDVPVTVDVLRPPAQPFPEASLDSIPAVQAWTITRTRRFDDDYLVSRPPDWLVNDAAAWLRTVAPDSPRPLARAAELIVDVDWDTLPGVAGQLASGSGVTVYGHDPRPGQSTTPLAWIEGRTYPSSARQLSVADPEQLESAMAEMRASLSDAAGQAVWSGVRVVDRADDIVSMISCFNLAARPRAGRADQRISPARATTFNPDLADLSVPGITWCQILGPGHIERLGGELPPEAIEVAPNRFEVVFGEPADWIGDLDNHAVRRAHDVLGRLVLSRDEAQSVWRRRFDAAPVGRALRARQAGRPN